MDYGALQILSIILMIVGPFGTFLPVLPGLVLSFVGFLLYNFGVPNHVSIIYVWIFGILTLVSLVLNYIIPAKTTKKYGGTRYGSIGSFVGTIAGMILIPIPLGFLIGMLAGVFVGEMLHDFKDKKKAVNSVKGALLGFIYGTGFNLIVALAMILAVIFDIFNN